MVTAKKLHRLFLCLSVLLVLISSNADVSARTMTFFNNPGTVAFPNPFPTNWSNPANWTGGFPGGEVLPGDEVHIVGFCHLDQTVLNRGRIRLVLNEVLSLGSTPTLVVQPGYTLTNNGTIYLTQSNYELKVKGFLNNPSYNGIECNGYLINEGGTINNAGGIWARAGGGFKNNSGTFDNYGTLQNQGTVTNAGTTNMYGGSLFSLFAASSALTEGTFTWFGGYININSGITVNIAAGQTLSQGASGTLRSWGTLNISGHYETAGPLEINAGRVNINSEGKFTRKAGGSFAGRLDLNAYGELVLEDGRPLPNTLVWQDEGTVTIAGEYYTSINVPVGGYLDIAPTGIYRIGQVFGTVLQINHATNVTNNGTIRLMNRGTILITAANAVLPARTGATFSWESGGEVAVAVGKTLYVDPSISVPVGGILNVSGKLSISNAFTVAGTLNLWGEHATVIGSPNLNVSGKLVYVNAYVPAVRNFLPFRVNFTNASVLEVQSLITLNVTNQQTFNVLSNSGTVNLNAGGILESWGYLNAFGQRIGGLYNYGTLNLNSGGILSLNAIEGMPGGTFNWNTGGNLEIGPTATLNLNPPSAFTVGAGRTLTLFGTMNLTPGSSLILNGTLDNRGTTNINGGRLTNNGLLHISGTLTVGAEGRLINNTAAVIPGTLNLMNQGQFRLSYASAELPTSNFNWQDGGKVYIEPTASLNLGSDLTMPPNSSLFVFGTMSILPAGNLRIGAGASMNNVGTFTNGGSLSLNDGGSIVINAPTTDLGGDNFIWAANSLVHLGNGVNYPIPHNLTVPAGATLKVGGTLNNPLGNTIISEGDVFVEATGSLVNHGVFLENGYVYNNRGGNVTNKPTGEFTVSSSARLVNGEFGKLDNEAGAKLKIIGHVYNFHNGEITNNGTITIGEEALLDNYANGVVINNNKLISIGKFSNHRNNPSNGDGRFDNTGTFTNRNDFNNNFNGLVNNSGLWLGETDLSINRLNNGTFNLLAGGNYQMNAPDTQWPKGTFNWSANSEVTVGEASTVAYPGFSALEIGIDRTLIVNGHFFTESAGSFNSGTITGTGFFSAYIDFSETGVIAPGNGVGELTFQGQLNLNDGTYACEIGGSFSNPADLLIIDGTPSLEYGKLLVTWISPPVHEASYTVMSYIGGPSTSYLAPENIIIPEVEGFTFEKIITASEVIIVASETALPVELMQFTATKSGKTALLAWQTATEQDNEGFSIERLSTATNQWAEIGFTPGAGTSTAMQAYAFTDLAPQGGENLYRLRQVDFSGDSTYSAIVSVRFDEQGALVIYPNPVGARLRVLNAEEGEYQIFNTVGQALLWGDLSNDIDVSQLLGGTYFLKIGTQTERFFKR
jgi:hypothetical protein